VLFYPHPWFPPCIWAVFFKLRFTLRFLIFIVCRLFFYGWFLLWGTPFFFFFSSFFFSLPSIKSCFSLFYPTPRTYSILKHFSDRWHHLVACIRKCPFITTGWFNSFFSPLSRLFFLVFPYFSPFLPSFHCFFVCIILCPPLEDNSSSCVPPLFHTISSALQFFLLSPPLDPLKSVSSLHLFFPP